MSKKSNESKIEVSVGNDCYSKYDIMKLIAQKYSIYGSTVWLNTPIDSENGKTPAELMMEGQTQLVYKLIQKSNGKFDL